MIYTLYDIVVNFLVIIKNNSKTCLGDAFFPREEVGGVGVEPNPPRKARDVYNTDCSCRLDERNSLSAGQSAKRRAMR